jgi:hypothetical protein
LLGGNNRELSTNVYRWVRSGKLDVVIAEDQLPHPRTCYVISTGRGRAMLGRVEQRVFTFYDVQDKKVETNVSSAT